jgi:hypothetical protein
VCDLAGAIDVNGEFLAITAATECRCGRSAPLDFMLYIRHKLMARLLKNRELLVLGMSVTVEI